MKAILKYPINLLVIFVSLLMIFVMAIIAPTFVRKGSTFLVRKWDKMLRPTKRK